MVRINITLPEDLLKQIEQMAKTEKINRSEFFRRAVITYQQIKKEEQTKERRKQAIKKAIRLQNRLREDTPAWNGVKALRKAREANK
jgi:metal-responsive CopG/Arc/MetJ family transcriptional regulator